MDIVLNTLPELLRERDKISEQLRLLNRQVEDLSLEELKNIVSMKERLTEVDYEINDIRSDLASRFDAVGILISNLTKNMETKLSKLKIQLGEEVHDDKKINNVISWLDGLENRLIEIMDFASVIEDNLPRQRTENRVESDCSELDTEPEQASLEEIEGDYGSEQHVKEKQPKNKFNNKGAVLTDNSLDPDATGYKKIFQPIPPVKENKELKKLSENIQNSIIVKSIIVKDMPGIIIDNQLLDNNEEVRKLQDFIKKQDKLKNEQPVKPNAKTEPVKNSKKRVNRQKTGTLKENIKPQKEEVNQHIKQIIASARAEAAAAQSEIQLPELVLPPREGKKQRLLLS